MSNLQQRQQKIQERRKHTPRREFIMEICSWCSLSIYKHEGILSRFPHNRRATSISRDSFFEERDAYTTLYKSNYIDSRSFLEQLQELFAHTPLPVLFGSGEGENCNYADMGGHAKNAYLSFVYSGGENICYSYNIKGSNNVYNSGCVWDESDNVYQSRGIIKSFNIFYSRGIHDSNNIRLCTDCIGCYECLYCNNLTNQSYCIHNIPLSKEEYLSQKRLLLKNKSSLQNDYIGLSSSSIVVTCDNVAIGNTIYNIHGGNNVLHSGGKITKSDFYDVLAGGSESYFYGVFQGEYFSQHIYCSAHITGGSNIRYSYCLSECSFCLGCIGLKNKSYCILNEQYIKEERTDKVNEIFVKMDAEGKLGQFFPPSMNPFYFNDTAAYLIDSTFTKEEVTAKGYLRRDEPIKVDIPEDAKVVASYELAGYEGFDNEGNRTINADILKYVIQDELGNYYRIIPMEYKFLVKHGLPLPRKHWLERMKENFKIN